MTGVDIAVLALRRGSGGKAGEAGARSPAGVDRTEWRQTEPEVHRVIEGMGWWTAAEAGACLHTAKDRVTRT